MLKRWLERLGWYDYLRYSWLYHQLLRIRNPKYLEHLNSDLRLYREILGSDLDLVIDIGANFGDKTWSLSKLAKRVVCIEPDVACCKALRTRFRHDPNIHILNAAVGKSSGEATFYVEQMGSAYNTLSEKQRDWVAEKKAAPRAQVVVVVTTLDKVIQEFGTPDFVKIDVEGFEKEVFEGLSADLPVICFEANLPRFLPETLEILDRWSGRDCKVNLRDGDQMVFDTFISLQQTRDYLVGLGESERSFDIFVIRGSSSPVERQR